MAVADIDFMLGKARGIPGLRKDDAADALIPVFLILIRIPDPDLVAIVEIVKGAEGSEEMALRRSHIFVKGTGGWGNGRAEGVHDGLEIVVVLLKRKQESVSFVAAKWPGEGTLFHVAAFGGFRGGQRIAGVKNRIAGKEIHGAVIGGCAGLSGDFNAGAAGPGKSRGIRILIDFHFLHGGSGDSRAVGLHAVDDER